MIFFFLLLFENEIKQKTTARPKFLRWEYRADLSSGTEGEQQVLKDLVPFSGMQQEEICRGEPKQEILQPA